MTILQVTSPGLVLKFKLLLLAHHCQEDFSCLMLKSPASLEKLSIAASYLVKISSPIGQFLNFTGFVPIWSFEFPTVDHLVLTVPTSELLIAGGRGCQGRDGPHGFVLKGHGRGRIQRYLARSLPVVVSWQETGMS
jgi:hypothetical protein